MSRWPLLPLSNLFSKLVPEGEGRLSHAPLMSKGLDIFRWLFPSSAPGVDTTHTLTDATPLADMISSCVDIEASFDDPMSLSRPQICPDFPDVSPLPTPSPSNRGFPQLLNFLHSHLAPHLQDLQKADTFYEVFATFIVGAPDHSNAGSALHSHLVGCATTDPITHHLAFYVAVGPDQIYKGAQEWAPLIVHLAASFLWPDLPFLVCSPDYVLGAHAAISELRRCLSYSSPLNLFTTTTSLAGSDVLVHLPPPCQFNFITHPLSKLSPSPLINSGTSPPRKSSLSSRPWPLLKWKPNKKPVAKFNLTGSMLISLMPSTVRLTMVIVLPPQLSFWL